MSEIVADKTVIESTNPLDDSNHARSLSELFESVLRCLGEDPRREGLRDTPERVERSLKHLTSGYGLDAVDEARNAVFKSETSEIVVVKDIEFYSLCEHHMLPFFGKVHIAYVPDTSILGLSKFARIAEVYAKRLQVQERLTVQIADAVEKVLRPKSLTVVIEARHLCMMMRGVQKQNSITYTKASRGVSTEELDRFSSSLMNGHDIF